MFDVQAPAGASRSAAAVLIRVRSALPGLRPAERRVAEAVLADPAAVSESPITAVARRCQTSETTVLRFCRAVGLAGYPELRIALARAAQREEAEHPDGPVSGTITENDSLADVVAKVSHADIRAIADTAASVDLVVLERAVTAVAGAGRVDLYGTGASGLVGEGLRRKLHRIGRTASQWSEPHHALASASLLGPGDVAIGISHSGTSLDTADALQVARSRGATTIALTSFAGSAVALGADLVLTTAARDTTFRSGATASRIAQLVLVDCLFTAVAQRSYDEALAALEAGSLAVQERRSRRAVRSVRAVRSAD